MRDLNKLDKQKPDRGQSCTTTIMETYTEITTHWLQLYEKSNRGNMMAFSLINISGSRSDAIRIAKISSLSSASHKRNNSCTIINV